MRPLIPAIAFLALASAATAAEDFNALFSGSEVRRSDMSGSDTMRFDRWNFAADGTFSGVFMIEHNSGTETGYEEEGDSTGKWRIDGNRLCIDEKGYQSSGVICFVLERAGGSGQSVEISGAELGSDHRWRFEVSRRRR